MALQIVSKNVIYTMVNTHTLGIFRVGRLLLAAFLLGIYTLPANAQHAFEGSARLGASALPNGFSFLGDYMNALPGYNIGLDFSYKYRSPYIIGARVGLGMDISASTFTKNNFGDSYVNPRNLDPSNMLTDVHYNLGQFTEMQQQIIATVPAQLGLFFGDFSLFIGVRAGLPIMGHYWQNIRDANMWLRYYDTGVEVGQNNAYDVNGNPIPLDDVTKAGNILRTSNRLSPLSKGALPSYYLWLALDLNYAFKIGENTDFSVGLYAYYDPIGYKPAVTSNTSLMEWTYVMNVYTGVPNFNRTYHSVLESNYAAGVTRRAETTYTPLIKKYNYLSVGIKLAISLWSVPIEDTGNYNKSARYKNVCNCEFW